MTLTVDLLFAAGLRKGDYYGIPDQRFRVWRGDVGGLWTNRYIGGSQGMNKKRLLNILFLNR